MLNAGLDLERGLGWKGAVWKVRVWKGRVWGRAVYTQGARGGWDPSDMTCWIVDLGRHGLNLWPCLMHAHAASELGYNRLHMWILAWGEILTQAPPLIDRPSVPCRPPLMDPTLTSVLLLSCLPHRCWRRPRRCPARRAAPS